MQAQSSVQSSRIDFLNAMGVDVWVRRGLVGPATQAEPAPPSVQTNTAQASPTASRHEPAPPIAMTAWRPTADCPNFCQQHKELMMDILRSVSDLRLVALGRAVAGEEPAELSQSTASCRGILLVGETVARGFLVDLSDDEHLFGRLHTCPESGLPCLAIPELDKLSQRPSLKRQLWRDLQLFSVS